MLSICQGKISQIVHNKFCKDKKFCEVFTMVKVKCQGHFKVKYLKMFIMNNFAITPCCEAFTKLKVI